ncbi:pre-peptidase C-terminal domain-containing protein [Pontibacter roseus]|uniref:pre-peptidase C-terminal domain-containing protein n=1 Tax=Pontibacter roseus TaxID=336989 RepID=UPI00035CCA3E|nr:pre-peptidase C-terminal domain-containing protein [Pontibacter roseus]
MQLNLLRYSKLTYLVLLFLVSIISRCKGPEPEPNPIPNPTPDSGAIDKIELKSGEILLHGSTPELIMAPDEATSITISAMILNSIETSPNNIELSSSDTKVVTVTAEGKVKAISNGSAFITGKDKAGNKVVFLVTVRQSDLPALTEPVFSTFGTPIVILNKEKSESIKPIILNRLGQKLQIPHSIIFQSGNTIKEISDNNPSNYPQDGIYNISCKVGTKELVGNTPAIICTPSNSTLAGMKPGMFHVNLSWGRYPVYFNKNELESQPVGGLVYRLTPTTLHNKAALIIHTTEEDVTVETENNTVISANGSTIKSVKAGLGKWRVNQDGYISPWNNSQVFFDFSGDWVCSNNKKGFIINMKVPDVIGRVYHRGAQGNYTTFFQLYELWANWFIQQDKAKTQFVDMVSKVASKISDAKIGPLSTCTICSYPTELQKPGWSHGELHTLYDNRRGVLTYINDNEFMLGDGTLNGPIFKRGKVDFTNPTNIPTSVLTRTPASIDAVSAVLGGTVSGTPEIIERGIIIDDTPYLTVDRKNTFKVGAGTGEFTTEVSGFAQNTKYYVRAYAKSATGVLTYGSELNFRTTGAGTGTEPGPGPGTGTSRETIIDQVLKGDSYEKVGFSFTLPAGVKTMEIRTTESAAAYWNTADLFVRKGSAPVVAGPKPPTWTPAYSWTADCHSTKSNREEEVCTFTNPGAGTWYVTLYGYNSHFSSRVLITITK